MPLRSILHHCACGPHKSGCYLGRERYPVMHTSQQCDRQYCQRFSGMLTPRKQPSIQSPCGLIFAWRQLHLPCSIDTVEISGSMCLSHIKSYSVLLAAGEEEGS